MLLKTTVRGILVDFSSDNRKMIDDMMIKFSSAMRFAFNRRLEHKPLKELEPELMRKYGLNRRQAKDAVYKADNIIKSQHELMKLFYDNYNKKVKAVEEALVKTHSEKRKRTLLKKLEKRQRKRDLYKKHLDNKTFPPVIFGGKDNFKKRCNNKISNAEWRALRNNKLLSRGDASKKGNPNLRIILERGQIYLRINTLARKDNGRYVKIKIPLKLPQKRTGDKINGRNYKDMVLSYALAEKPYQVELIREGDKYHCHITFEEDPSKIVTHKYNGVIGIDTNPDGFALTAVDYQGNYLWHKNIVNHELTYARSNRRLNIIGELVKEVVLLARDKGMPVVIEDLKFKKDKDVQRKFARVTHQFVYKGLLETLERTCKRYGVELIKVKPAYTSIIGLYKYSHQYGLVVHNGAAMVIARRGLGYQEKLPKPVKRMIKVWLTDKQFEKFKKANEWKRWSMFKKLIKKKGGVNPDWWSHNRKSLLMITA